MNKGVVIFLLILVLALAFGWESANGVFRKSDFAGKVSSMLPTIRKTNMIEVRDSVIQEGKTFGFYLTKNDVVVKYEPTTDQKFTEQFVAKLADFEKYRAEITVIAPVRVWGITISNKPITRWQITHEKAVYKQNAELEKALKMVDEAASGQKQSPPPPPLSRQGIQDRFNPQRPELEKELAQ